MDCAFVLYRADPAPTPWTELCLRQADCLVVVRNADSDEPTRLPFEIEAAQTGRGVPSPPRAGAAARGPRSQARLDGRQLAGGLYGQHHHVRLDLPSDFDRLARLITGHAVGVVMAGGGARAFTHIGVVKALRASGVPIDQVGGTSMGAIVAAGVAARWTDDELAERFRRSFVTANPLSDYTLPFVSLFGGRRVTTLLRTAFGDKDIEDLILPFYCVTANLTTANADTHTIGKLWRWLRASVALPGVLPPFNDAGQVHVDGGVIDNLPVARCGGRAAASPSRVDIDTGGALAAGAGVEEAWSAWEFFRRLVWKREETLPIPSIVRILLRSALVASAARADGGSRRGRPADRAADGQLSTCSTGRASTPPSRPAIAATMKALDKARTLPIGARIFLN